MISPNILLKLYEMLIGPKEHIGSFLLGIIFLAAFWDFLPLWFDEIFRFWDGVELDGGAKMSFR